MTGSAEAGSIFTPRTGEALRTSGEGGAVKAGAVFGIRAGEASCFLETGSHFPAEFVARTGGKFLTRAAPEPGSGGPFAVAGGTFGRRAAGFAAAGSTRSAGASRTATGRSVGTLGAEFLLTDFSVVVLVEDFERVGGVGDFLRGELAIFIRIQGGHQRRHATAGAALGTTGTRAAGRRRRTAAFRLGLDERGAGGEDKADEDCFHNVAFYGLGCRFAAEGNLPHIDTMALHCEVLMSSGPLFC